MGRSMTPFSSSCLKMIGVFVWLRCSEGARPSMLPDSRRVLTEDFEGRQCANAKGTVTLIVGRWNSSVGRPQFG